METWKTNLDETKKRYIDWWNHKGIRNGSIRNGVQNTWTGTWHTAV